MESKVRFLSLNIGMKKNLDSLCAVLEVNNPDIVFLQEVVLTTNQLEYQIKRLGYLCEVNNAEEISKPGTALLWKSHLHISDFLSLVVGRAQIALFGDYVLLNVYAPSGSSARNARNTFFAQNIFSAFNLYPSAMWIIGGDQSFRY